MIKKILFLFYTLVFTNAIEAQKFPDSRTDGKYYTVNGAKLYTVTVGTGDPIIIIPGGPGGNHLSYRDFDSLSVNSNIQLIYFDAFGRGKSDTAKDVKEYSLDRDIEDIEGLRKAMHLDKISLLGHSYGSLVAQGYAVKYGQNLSHLIIANGFHSFVMWQENDDNSNHEIKTNYPEVWQQIDEDPRTKALYQAMNLIRIFTGRFLMDFCMHTIPSKFTGGGNRTSLTQILSIQNCIIKW